MKPKSRSYRTMIDLLYLEAPYIKRLPGGYLELRTADYMADQGITSTDRLREYVGELVDIGLIVEEDWKYGRALLCVKAPAYLTAVNPYE